MVVLKGFREISGVKKIPAYIPHKFVSIPFLNLRKLIGIMSVMDIATSCLFSGLCSKPLLRKFAGTPAQERTCSKPIPEWCQLLHLCKLVAMAPFVFPFRCFRCVSMPVLLLHFIYTCSIASFSELPHFQGGTPWSIFNFVSADVSNRLLSKDSRWLVVGCDHYHITCHIPCKKKTRVSSLEKTGTICGISIL